MNATGVSQWKFMFWTLFGIVVFAIAFGTLVYFNVSDRKAGKKSVIETMSDRVWDELAYEREAALTRARKFKKALEEAGRKNK